MYAFQASLPLSLPPPVSFSPPKAPPISAPEVPIFTLAIPQSDPDAERNITSAVFSHDSGGQTLRYTVLIDIASSKLVYYKYNMGAKVS
jgi:hypothetical protein